eukprot:EC717381.1.p2 GENE.EC717381.1~~EC717381.1.p2  ORF type:complete len:58 (+),score=2.61 EC717381.1:18-191(+)
MFLCRTVQAVLSRQISLIPGLTLRQAALRKALYPPPLAEVFDPSFVFPTDKVWGGIG